MISYHNHPLEFFASVAGPLERVFLELVGADPDKRQTRESELWMEAGERLAQADFLVSRSKKLQEQWRTAMKVQTDTAEKAGGAGAEARQRYLKSSLSRSRSFAASELLFELKLCTKAFYYFAFRFVTILKLFPQFKSFDAPGVRQVRNWLIEHGEKGQGVTQQDWSLDNNGLALRSASPRATGKEQVHKDAGLLVTACELRERLSSRLKRLLDGQDRTGAEGIQ